MPARLHSFVEHANDFHKAGLDCPIEDHVRRIGDSRVADVPKVKASDAREQVRAVPC